MFVVFLSQYVYSIVYMLFTFLYCTDSSYFLRFFECSTDKYDNYILLLCIHVILSLQGITRNWHTFGKSERFKMLLTL